MIANGNTSFEKIGKASVDAGKKTATTGKKYTGRALEVGARTGSAAVSKNPKAASSTKPNVFPFWPNTEGVLFWKNCLDTNKNNFQNKKMSATKLNQSALLDQITNAKEKKNDINSFHNSPN